jgi:hypothetical protein
MAYGKLYYGVVIEDQHRNLITLGDLSTPVSLPAIDGRVCRKEFSVATLTTKEVFNVDNDLPDFDFFYLVSDTTGVYFEWTVDTDGTYGTTYATKSLYANCPVWLIKDAAYANYTANFGGGTIDVIERFRVRNTTTGTAKVSIFAVT